MSTQPLDLLNIRYSKVINIVAESLIVFLDRLCKGCGPNNKLLSDVQDIIRFQQ